jgi:hypothetical protein
MKGLNSMWIGALRAGGVGAANGSETKLSAALIAKAGFSGIRLPASARSASMTHRGRVGDSLPCEVLSLKGTRQPGDADG